MSEFVDDNFKIILFNNKGESKEHDFGYFFNGRFEPNSKIGNKKN
jgi:cytidine deaminase